ncbi:MAG TPA: Ig-like domain-containing protein [Vicinamibacteria bacterium]|nr:Ig-like domain-containing protein [Vicinamibacteria bacterium]
MSNSRGLAVGLALLGAGAAVGIIACESVPLTAAPGTSMTLIANPTFVIANGGVSVVTAILVEPVGTFVPDGTEVFFFTNLGRIDPLGKTVNGVARVNFVADSRSGEANITAVSGGPAPAASPGTGTGTGTGSAVTTIKIGSTLPTRVQVAANPQRITSPRQSTITATVFDLSGNPVQNVPVSFSISGSLIEETLASGGAPIFTDSSGQARDTLFTRAPAGGLQKTVTVAATTANGIEGSVTVFID